VSFVATQTTHLISFSANQTQSCGMIIDSLKLEKETPNCSVFEKDTINLCTNDSIVFDVTEPNSTYLWQDGSTSPIYTINTPGTYWVEITSDSGCVCRDQLIVNQDSTCELSVKENGEFQLLVYPNPTNGIINIVSKQQLYSEITIVDLNGKIVKKVNSYKSTNSIDLSDIENGFYIIMIKNSKGLITKKIQLIK
jgi:hypothetical protein